MKSSLSGKISKWLKWPSDKQIVFLLACGLVTVLFAFDLDASLGQSITIFFVISFIGLLIVGWYNKLWLVPLAGFITYLLALFIEAVFDPSDFFVADLGSTLYSAWFLLILLLWFIPHRIEENAQKLEDEAQSDKLLSPRFKLSELFVFFWASFWGLILLVEFVYLAFEIEFIMGLDSAADFYTYRDVSDLLRRIDFAIWAPIALLFFADLLRKDARLFYSAVGVFTAWQFIKLIVFYFTPYPVQEYTATLVLILLLIGGSLLLRAAWNRPPPKSIERV